PDFISLINVLLEAGDTTKALHHLNIFTSKNQSVAAHVITVKILLSRGDWEETYKEVVKGLETASNTPSYKDQYSFLLYAKGLIYLNDQNDKMAVEYFTRAIFKDGSNSEAYLERGKLYFKQGKLNQAKKDLEHSAELGNVVAQAMLHNEN
ncbi:MAG: hypothetical protein RIA63_03025, partial [Cyclobacteriaceae bacterium]